MIEFITKLFIKNYDTPENPEVRKKYGTLSSVVGICVNFILSLIKLIAGLLSSSSAIIADALNNLSDAASSVVTFISFKISSKPADRGHPFGHARMEYISSMIVSLLILLVGFEMIIESFKNIFSGTTSNSLQFGPITIIILSISIAMKLWLAIFYRSIGNKIKSSVVKASSIDSLFDSISTAAVLISSIIIHYNPNLYIIDSIVGMCVSVMILVAGGKILIETKDALLGEGPVDEMVKSINNIINEYPDVEGMHDLMVHNYGPNHYIASFHAEVDGKKDIYMLHDMIDNLERNIKERLGIACTIHMDPIVTDDETVVSLKNFLKETMSECELNLSIHDFRVVIGESHTNLIFDVVVPYEYHMHENDVCSKIAKAVEAKRPNCYCVITVDRN
jgi:cation diffusion facilitator family transporter